MNVQIVILSETKVAAIEHQGSPALEHNTAKMLIAWKL
jgi:AraC family transcriptional regulator